MTPEELAQEASRIRTQLTGTPGKRIIGRAEFPVDVPLPISVTVQHSLADQDFPALPEKPNDISGMLLDMPGKIRDEQAVFDNAERYYRARLADITIRAFSEPLFPGKKPEDGMRPASNDTEREAAIAKLTGSDNELIRLAMAREAALRNLNYARNKFEALRLAAQLQTNS